MPKKIPQSELDNILQQVDEFPDGISVGALLPKINPKVSRRTLQRRLERLVSAGKLIKSGQGSATSYRNPAHVYTAIAEGGIHSEGWVDTEIRISISPEAEKTRQNVNRPLHARTPVGYRREFLEEYQPNKSFYLSQSILSELKNISQAIDDVRHLRQFQSAVCR